MANSVDFEKFKNETGLDDPTLKELYEGFLQELLDEKDKLLRQLSRKDYENIYKTVHNIKGISGSYMAGNVFNRSHELGARLKAGNTEDTVTLVNMLVNDIIEAAGEILNFYKK